MACFMNEGAEVSSVSAQGVHALHRACVGLPLQSNVVWDSRRYIFPATSPSPWLGCSWAKACLLCSRGSFWADCGLSLQKLWWLWQLSSAEEKSMAWKVRSALQGRTQFFMLIVTCVLLSLWDRSKFDISVQPVSSAEKYISSTSVHYHVGNCLFSIILMA